MPKRQCAYCGRSYKKGEGGQDHVAPSCLYPHGSPSRIPRITVPACTPCNKSWSDHEPHFRTVVLLASKANPPTIALWDEEVGRALFREVDSRRRINQLKPILEKLSVDSEALLKIYPARDPSVLLVARKAVRGLMHHHRFGTAVPEEDVWVDVHRFAIPAAFESDFVEPAVTDRQVFRYRYHRLDSADISFAWLLTFYDNCTFLGIVGPGMTVDRVP